MAQRDTLAGELALATEKIAGLQLAVEQEKERANGEHSARLQAERMAQSHITDLTEQRNNMTLAVEANTGELRTLSTRLEDERRRAGEQKTVVLEKELRKEMSYQTLEHFYLQKRYSDLCAQTTKLRELLNKEEKPRSFRGKTLGKMLPGRAVRIKALRRRPSA